MALLPGNDCLYLFHYSGFQLSYPILAALSNSIGCICLSFGIQDFINNSSAFSLCIL
jgi:hypothetical protein